MSADMPITKENLDTYLKELGKQYRRINGKSMPVEIILIGGASILINYGFRDSTYTDAGIVTGQMNYSTGGRPCMLYKINQ